MGFGRVAQRWELHSGSGELQMCSDSNWQHKCT